MEPILEMRKICKYFAGVRANYNVDLTVYPGEAHALLGENGAGKSTLMNILYGLYTPTSGEIRINGKTVSIRSPKEAIALGVGMVHQHFMLVPALTVIENVVLGMKGSRFDLNAAAKEFTELAHRYNMDLDPKAKVWQLTVGQQQRLEILKAIYRGANILILDEPTAVLTPQEVEELFSIIEQLKQEGKTILFITHKLNEVMRVCERITVLRTGEVSATLSAKETDQKRLAQLMVGYELLEMPKKAPVSEEQQVILQMKDVCCLNSKGLPGLKEINLEVHAGEILGICGVDGNGQSELCDCITGLREVTQGTISIDGQDTTNRPVREILDHHVSHIPEDRHKRGGVLSMSLIENILLMNYWREPFSKGQLLQWNKINEFSDTLLEQFNVKTPSAKETLGHLSGGNQQKVVLGRELMRDPKLIIAMHPARGLDIGATSYVQKKLIEQRDNGAAVLLVSTELEELIYLSDRIAVIYEGKIVGIVSPDTPIEKLGLMMAGSKE